MPYKPTNAKSFMGKLQSEALVPSNFPPCRKQEAVSLSTGAALAQIDEQHILVLCRPSGAHRWNFVAGYVALGDAQHATSLSRSEFMIVYLAAEVHSTGHRAGPPPASTVAQAIVGH